MHNLFHLLYSICIVSCRSFSIAAAKASASSHSSCGKFRDLEMACCERLDIVLYNLQGEWTGKRGHSRTHGKGIELSDIFRIENRMKQENKENEI